MNLSWIRYVGSKDKKRNGYLLGLLKAIKKKRRDKDDVVVNVLGDDF